MKPCKYILKTFGDLIRYMHEESSKISFEAPFGREMGMTICVNENGSLVPSTICSGMSRCVNLDPCVKPTHVGSMHTHISHTKFSPKRGVIREYGTAFPSPTDYITELIERESLWFVIIHTPERKLYLFYNLDEVNRNLKKWSESYYAWRGYSSPEEMVKGYLRSLKRIERTDWLRDYFGMRICNAQY